jgi:hypothetical protein
MPLRRVYHTALSTPAMTATAAKMESISSWSVVSMRRPLF